MVQHTRASLLLDVSSSPEVFVWKHIKTDRLFDLEGIRVPSHIDP